MAYGTLVTLDTLASTQQTIAEIGEDRVFNAVNAALVAHNTIMNELIDKFADTTTDRLRRYGGDDNMSLDEVDEHGRADAQKISAGATLGFPLRLFQVSLQWTRKYFQNHTGKEMAVQVTAVMKAHRRRVSRELKRAFFKPTNSTFIDRLVDHVSLNPKALVNADSAPIPPGPNGEAFDSSTHTHYLATASLVEANVVSLLDTVREHYNSGSQVLFINRAQESAIRAMSKFTGYLDARIIGTITTNQAAGTLNPLNPYNRAIGIFDSAEVWVKPWIPAGYILSYLDGVEKPLAKRERSAGQGNLIIAAEDEQYPLRAKTMEAEFALSVWNRTNGAVLYTGSGSYVEPTIND